jgi:hypothetical protein
MSNLHLIYAIRYCRMDKPELLKEIDWCDAQIKDLASRGEEHLADLNHFLFIRNAATNQLIQLGCEFPQLVREKYLRLSVGLPYALSELI